MGQGGGVEKKSQGDNALPPPRQEGVSQVALLVTPAPSMHRGATVPKKGSPTLNAGKAYILMLFLTANQCIGTAKALRRPVVRERV